MAFLNRARVGMICFAQLQRADIGATVLDRCVNSLVKDYELFAIRDIISNVDQARNSAEELNSLRTDATIIVASTVGTASPMVISATTLRMPILIWIPIPETHALPSSLQVADTLRAKGRPYELVYGDSNDPETTKRIKRFIVAAKTLGNLKYCKVGQINNRRPELICGSYDERKLLIEWEIEALQISKDEVLSVYDKTSKEAISPLVSDLLKKVKMVEATLDDLEKSVRLYSAIKEIVGRHKLKGVAINGYPHFDGIEPSAALACAMLNDEGIMTDYEGDVIAVVTMMILRSLADRPVFLAEPYRIDEKENEVFFFHRSAPLSLGDDEKASVSGRGMYMNVPVKLNTVTIARLDPMSLKKFHVLVGEVTPSKSQSPEAMSEVVVKLKNAREFLENAFGNHYSIVPGDIREEFKSFCELAKADFVET